MKLVAIALFFTVVSAIDEPLRKTARRKLSTKGSSKGSKGSSGACVGCFQELPGYSFFGENYLDEDFYEGLVSGSLFLDINEPEYGEDYFVPGPFEISTDGETCYDDPGNAIFCGILTFISELIYSNDVLKCLLTNIIALIRDEECVQTAAAQQMTLQDVSPLSMLEAILQGDRASLGIGSIGDIFDTFNLDISLFMESLPDDRRKLLIEDKQRKLDKREDQLGFLNDVLNDIPGKFVESLQNNLFFFKCLLSVGDLGLCAVLFSLLKTIDASVCYYREELGCGADECSKDAMFDIGYETERLAIDLPLPPEVAIVAAPCSNCLASKTNGCAAFCNLYSSYHTCKAPSPIIAPFVSDTSESKTSEISASAAYAYVDQGATGTVDRMMP